ncbi:MAG: ChbG/HpnK family deacetylase [Patescibacteria group bacterium]
MKPKYLIVNADDFGMSNGITDGIIEAHERGIVTSTSLMIIAKESSYAAKKSMRCPRLSVGLHGVFKTSRKDTTDVYLNQLENQLKVFIALIGKKPTHFDVHGVPPTSTSMMFAARCFIAMHKFTYRGIEGTKVIKNFYGMKGRTIIPGAVSVEKLSQLLNSVNSGTSVLVCHPGQTSNRLTDPYRIVRNQELKTLTSSKIVALIRNKKIQLLNFKEVVSI